MVISHPWAFRSVFVLTAIGIVAGTCFGNGGATAISPKQPKAPTQEVWIVDTRGLPSCPPDQPAHPAYWRMNGQCTWAASDEKTFLATDHPSMPTIVHVHGNRYTADDAVQEGYEFYCTLKTLAPQASFRFVIWSWPSERIAGRNRADVLVKDERCEVEAVYLAQFLARIEGDVPVSLIGHSYGAKTVVGALQLTAGMPFAGTTIPKPAKPRQVPMRAMLAAAAVEWTALAACPGQASPLDVVDGVLVTENTCDGILRLYPRLYRHGPPALGYAGPAGLDSRDPRSARVERIDMSCAIGKHHGWPWYMATSAIQDRWAHYALFQTESR